MRLLGTFVHDEGLQLGLGSGVNLDQKNTTCAIFRFGGIQLAWG